MGLIFKITYHELVVQDDIPKLALEWRSRIKKSIEDRLMRESEVFGKPLRQSLKGYRKLRVGDYRVVFRIEKKNVKILMIQHCSIVYDNAKTRIRR
jgi:mRNA interferase RelE/StbE